MRSFSILPLAVLISTSLAFVPSNTHRSSTAVTSLSAVSGDVTRAARGTYANHGTGEIGSFDRVSPMDGATQNGVCGDLVREARSTYANHGAGEIGSFDRTPPNAGASIGSVIGDEVREERSTYASHGTGVVGSTQRQPFLPNSSTGAGGHDARDSTRDDDGDWRT